MPRQASRLEPSPDHAPLLERAFCLDPPEDSYRVESVDGEIPSFVRGTYYVNGPARFSRGGVRYRHWLDGDGMVSALRFSERGAHFTSRFVHSTKFREETAAGRAMYRGFGTAFKGDRLVRGVALASPVNVSVFPFRDAVLAFGEQGLPWELDPVTLETRGEYTFGRRLSSVSPLSAHPKFDGETGDMFNFGMSFAARRPCLNVYRFAADGTLLYRRRVGVEHPYSVHDFGMSSKHLVFYLSPYLLDMEHLAGGAPPFESLSWRPELGSRLRVLTRRDGEAVASIDVGSGYCLHLIACFEEAGRLVVDVVELEEPVYDQYDVPHLFPAARGARPVRYSIDLGRGAVEAREELDYGSMCDFPAIDPRKAGLDYRDFWVLGISASERWGRKFFDQLVHCDWTLGKPGSLYQAPPLHYLGGEPVFLPDPEDECRGAILCQEFDAENRASAFLLFNAFDLSRGPIATLRLKAPLHLGFHASYDPEAGAH